MKPTHSEKAAAAFRRAVSVASIPASTSSSSVARKRWERDFGTERGFSNKASYHESHHHARVHRHFQQQAQDAGEGKAVESSKVPPSQKPEARVFKEARQVLKGTETVTQLVFKGVFRTVNRCCHAKNSESSAWGLCLSRPEPIRRQDAHVPQVTECG